VKEIIERCVGEYRSDGLAGLRSLPTASMDLIFSQAVLEHVRAGEFDETMRECRRILKPGGAFTNQVDLRDHLGGELNNLRFDRARWESNLFVRSGFYTNRIRYSDMLGRFRAAGFAVEKVQTVGWERLPTPRQALAPEFRALSDEELCISSFFVVLR
jgi:predicted SAM-dependent methyltransferase